MADKIIGFVSGLLLGGTALSLFYAFIKRKAYKEAQSVKEVAFKKTMMEQAHELAKKEVEAKIQSSSDDDLAALGNEFVRKHSGNHKD